MDQVTLKWRHGMVFDADIDGQKLVVSLPDADEKGIRPKPLMLTALAGCTGLDVASLMEKMRVDVDDFQIEVSADRSVEGQLPAVYTSFEVVYRFYGLDQIEEKIIKAVTLSQQKYCGVSDMLSRVAPLSYKVLLNDRVVYHHAG